MLEPTDAQRIDQLRGTGGDLGPSSLAGFWFVPIVLVPLGFFADQPARAICLVVAVASAAALVVAGRAGRRTRALVDVIQAQPHLVTALRRTPVIKGATTIDIDVGTSHMRVTISAAGGGGRFWDWLVGWCPNATCDPPRPPAPPRPAASPTPPPVRSTSPPPAAPATVAPRRPAPTATRPRRRGPPPSSQPLPPDSRTASAGERTATCWGRRLTARAG
jgi:hypothetical protein